MTYPLQFTSFEHLVSHVAVWKLESIAAVNLGIATAAGELNRLIPLVMPQYLWYELSAVQQNPPLFAVSYEDPEFRFEYNI